MSALGLLDGLVSDLENFSGADSPALSAAFTKHLESFSAGKPSAPAVKSTKPAAKAKESKPQQKKKDKKKKNKAPAQKKEDNPLFSRLDIRVGRVLRAWKHPEADSLYVEEIDLGEETPRQVVSGLVKYVPEAQMQGAKVLVIVNLKPSAMRGIKSYGMVLAASDAAKTKVELVEWPEGSHVGERVTLEGMDIWDMKPDAKVDGKKKNHAWQLIVPGLMTNTDRVACYNGTPIITSAGPCKSPTIAGGNVA